MGNDKEIYSKNIPMEFGRAHVVIVDDDPTNRTILRSVCEKIGVGIINEAEDGLAALDVINKLRPDLVLLDVLMPRMGGLELMSKLRSNPELDGMPILVQTSLQGADDRTRCFEGGATDVVSKPFHLVELRARITAHLRSAISARVLFDFRNRIQAHIEITHAFIDAVLPSSERVGEISGKYGLKCRSVYKPHDEIGGDFWTLRALDDENVAAILVDASAHGLAGAINALRVDCLIQQCHEVLFEPDIFIKRLDEAMAKISFGQLFAGAVAFKINKNTGRMDYAGSGIPAPLLLRQGEFTELPTGGLPLGSGMVSAEKRTAEIAIGDMLFMFSDGLSDSVHEESLETVLKSFSYGLSSADELLAGAEQLDDVTLVVLQRG